MFFDFDNDGWPDLILVNGHVYPEVDKRHLGSSYEEPTASLSQQRQRHVYGHFRFGWTGHYDARASARGLAIGDLWNDGQHVGGDQQHEYAAELAGEPDALENHWVELKTVGTKSNRDGIGAKISVKAGARTMVDEVRSGSSYISNNDMRVHFGLGATTKIDWVRGPLAERLDRAIR